MFRLSLPGTSVELRCFAPFLPDSRWLAFALSAALVLAVVLLHHRRYRRPLGGLEKSRVRILVALRTLALVAVLALAVYRPEVVRVADTVVPSRVVVAVDLSGSMAVVDGDKITRAARTADALESRPSLFAPDAAGGRTTEWIGFDSRSVPFAAPGDVLQRLRTLPAGPSTEGSDLGEALLDASAGTTPLAAVVLVSDGRHNRGPSPLAVAEELGRKKIPAFTVDPAADDPPPDISVLALAAPAAVFAESEVLVEATVAIRGQPAGPIRVVLERTSDPADADLRRETVAHDGIDRTVRVTFRHKVGKAGSERLRVRAESLTLVDGRKPRDSEPRNDARSLTVRIAPEKAKVLLIDAEPDWEFHYLHGLLLRDRSVEVAAVALDQPRLGNATPDELRRAGYADTAFPDDAEAIPSCDVVVLGDLSPEQLPMVQRRRLMEFVADRGGTLVIHAGRRSMPLDWERIPADDPFRRLLPIRLPRATTSTTGIAVVRTPEGLETPWLRLGVDAASDLETWADLPPVYRTVTGVAAPGASVLATAREGNAPAGDPREGLLVKQNYGFGAVVWVGIDSTWRWRRKVGDTLHHRFWGQMIRWAAADRPATVGNAAVRFGPRRPSVGSDGDVPMIARFAPHLRLRDDAPVGLRILRPATATDPERTVRVVPLTAGAGDKGERRADVRGLPPGDYLGELTAPGLEDELRDTAGKPLRCRWTVSADEGDELADLAGNRALLEEISRVSGGSYLKLDDLDKLAALLPEKAVETSTISRVRLRDEGIVYLPLLLLLAGEWFLRRRWGLV